jgi:hypothetical protein
VAEEGVLVEEEEEEEEGEDEALVEGEEEELANVCKADDADDCAPGEPLFEDEDVFGGVRPGVAGLCGAIFFGCGFGLAKAVDDGPPTQPDGGNPKAQV